jgi:hypothetical protein
MYYQLFTRVFRLIEERFNYRIRWRLLHNEGFSAMVMDMDTKQLPGNTLKTLYERINNLLGFGRYLQDIDPERRPVQWQVERSVIYCLIHYQRGIERAVGRGSRHPDSPYGHCMALLNAETRGEYDRLCDELQGKH